MKQVCFNGIELLKCQHIRADVRCNEGKGAVLFCDGENIAVRIPQSWENADEFIGEIIKLFWENGFDTFRTDRQMPTMEEILGRELRYMNSMYGNSYVCAPSDYRKLWFTRNCVTIIGYVCYHRENVPEKVIDSTVNEIQKKLEENLPK